MSRPLNTAVDYPDPPAETPPPENENARSFKFNFASAANTSPVASFGQQSETHPQPNVFGSSLSWARPRQQQRAQAGAKWRFNRTSKRSTSSMAPPRKDKKQRLEEIRVLSAQHDIPIEKCADSIKCLGNHLQSLRFEEANVKDKLHRKEEDLNERINALREQISRLETERAELPERKELEKVKEQISLHQTLRESFEKHKRRFEDRFMEGKIDWTAADLKFWIRTAFPGIGTKYYEEIMGWDAEGPLSVVHVSDVLLQTIGIRDPQDRQRIMIVIQGRIQEERERKREDENACHVCKTKDRNYVLYPCGHRCVCEDCQAHFLGGRCPTCREHVDDIIRVYL